MQIGLCKSLMKKIYM